MAQTYHMEHYTFQVNEMEMPLTLNYITKDDCLLYFALYRLLHRYWYE